MGGEPPEDGVGGLLRAEAARVHLEVVGHVGVDHRELGWRWDDGPRTDGDAPGGRWDDGATLGW